MSICLPSGAPPYSKKAPRLYAKLRVGDMQVDPDLLMPPVPQHLRPPDPPALSQKKIVEELEKAQETLDLARSAIRRRHITEAKSLCLSAESRMLNLQKHSGLTYTQANLARTLFFQARMTYPNKGKEQNRE